MPIMTQDEIRHFLSEGTRTGKLATVRADGRPHIAPIWFVLDGDDLVFNTGHATIKAQNLEREGRASLCVDDERPPFSYVIVEGVVTIEKEPADNVAWATKIAARYMGSDLAEAYGQRNGVPGEWLVRLKPTRYISAKNVSD